MFNTIKLTAPGLPEIRFNANKDGGVTIYATAPDLSPDSPGYRAITINPAGGHWEVSALKSIGAGTGWELDGDGRPVVQQP